MIKVTIQDFTGVYAEQPFMQELRRSATADGEIRWFDCTQIDGSDCYCDDEAQAILGQQIESVGNNTIGIHFFDNGNYHYMSKLWTDNVTVIGVADHLVEEIREDLTQANAAEILNRVTFIRESELKKHPENLSSFVCSELASVLSSNIYLSIDKDALNTQEAATNWDQGSLTFEQLANTLQVLIQNRKISGIDICGERARDMGFEDTAAADALNNALNEKLFRMLTGLHGIQ